MIKIFLFISLFLSSTYADCYNGPMIYRYQRIFGSEWASDMGTPPFFPPTCSSTEKIVCSWQNGFVEDTGRVLIDRVCKYYEIVSQCPNGQVPDSTGLCACPVGTYRATDVCLPECPAGSHPSPSNICKTCPSPYVYHYNSDSCIDPTDCKDLGALVNGTCTDLSPYNGKPDDCRNHGGYPILGLGKGTSTFLTPTILCLDYWDFVGTAASDFLGLASAAAPIGRGAKGLLEGIDYLGGIIKNTPDTSNYPLGGKVGETDLTLGLPKINPNGSINSHPVTESPTPPNSQPKVDIDAYNAFLRDVYFPKNPNQDPNNQSPSIADLDRFNTYSDTYKTNGTDPSYSYSFKPDLGNIWKSTTGTTSTAPVYDSPKLNPQVPPTKVFEPISTTYPNLFDNTSPLSSPNVYATVPVSSTTTKTTTSTGLSVDRYSNTKTYPDGSTSLEVIDFSPEYKKGTQTITTVRPNGFSSTTSVSFEAPNYTPATASTPEAWGVKQTSPVSSTPVPLTTSPTYPQINFPTDPVTGLPVSPNPDGSSPLPQTSTGQDIINAPMPSYNIPQTGEFILFDKNPVSEMVTGISDLTNNISSQLSSANGVFNNTLALVNGSWTPPTIPNGSCGDSMAFDVFNRHVDLCPPMANFSSHYSPLISSLVTIGGIALSISIFLGGM